MGVRLYLSKCVCVCVENNCSRLLYEIDVNRITWSFKIMV